MSLKYSIDLEINAPREKVIKLFDSTENLVKWQKGLVSFNHISGDAGQVGAKSELKYKMGKREIEMVETITVRNFPDSFSATYETKDVWNHHENFFLEKEDNKTLWTTHTEFKCSSLFMKLMITLMPGMFKKQSLQTMRDFKNFVEAHE